MTNQRALIDPAHYPLDRILMDRDEVMRRNPQRGDFLQVESILHLDVPGNLIVGHRRVREDEFWTHGHLPGRPLFPGVMMCETMAQVSSIHALIALELPEDLFFGLGALEKVRFRAAITPPADLWVAGRILKASRTRPYFSWTGQILHGDGTLVAEMRIVGVGM